MSEDDSKRWDAGLSGLLEAERGNVWAPEEAEERVWNRLGASLPPTGTGGGGAPAAPRALRGSRPRIGSYLLGVVTGVVGTMLVLEVTPAPVHQAPTAELAPVAPVERETAAPLLVAAPVAITDAAPSSAARAATASTPTSIARPSSSLDRSLDAERLLLDDARSALGRGDGAGALRATALHAQRFPLGFLTEEREAIAIQALLLVSRYDDARQREAAFESKYPHSMLLQAVRASVESIP
jgi:hypothetical protein